MATTGFSRYGFLAASLAAAASLPLGADHARAQQTATLSPQALWYAAYLRDSRLVPLPDGRKLNLYCIGAGSPSVILESGLGGDAYNWRAVQDDIAKQTRVCAYDRAGFGKSSPGPLPRDAKAEVADLEALLKAADLRGPYVLVGHSMGSYIVRLFADRHPDDVAGMVLVDPSVENQLPVIEAVSPAIAEGDKKSLARARHCGMPDLSADILNDCASPPPSSFPPDLATAWVAGHGAASVQAFSSEAESFFAADTPEVAAERRSFGSMPLIVLTRGERSTNIPADQAEAEWTAWNKMHDDLTKLSTVGVNRTVPGANHYIQLDKPDAVVDAVAEVVTKAREQRDPRK
ncbi:MAG: alpha/beta hydrolase [Rhizomicrobium sp.]|jgi:pimeloyl-ACP methyl ester carboxylesterase